MRRVLMATAAAMLGLASPAYAAVSLTDTTGTPLDNQIYGDPLRQNNNVVVYGSAPNNDTTDNIRFTGNSLLDISSGQAQVRDSTVDGSGNLNWIIVNPDDLFDTFKFSTQLEGVSGTVYIYYLLTGGGFDANALNSYIACGNVNYCGLAGTYLSGQQDNINHLLAGGTFDGFLIATTDSLALFQAKQMSYNTVTQTPPVPEPATWALMLLGFGGIGMALRRGRRRKPALMQIA